MESVRIEHETGKGPRIGKPKQEEDPMKQYLLSIYQPDGPVPPPEVLTTVMQKVNALLDETKAAGAWVFNGGLHPPSTATVVRLQDGELLTTDGPFAEGRNTSVGSWS